MLFREDFNLSELAIVFVLSVPIQLLNTCMAYHYRLLTLLGVISLFVLSVTSQGEIFMLSLVMISRSFFYLAVSLHGSYSGSQRCHCMLSVRPC